MLWTRERPTESVQSNSGGAKHPQHGVIMRTIEQIEADRDYVQHRLHMSEAPSADVISRACGRWNPLRVWADNEHSLRMQWDRLTNELLRARGIEPA